MARDTKDQKVGTATVLFTDLVGSTEMLDRLGDDAADRLRRRHFRLLRRVVQNHGGREVKSLGDGLMVVFPSAYDAAACAIAIQKTSADEPNLPEVRVGLHSGEVAWEEGDIFGTPVVVARRLCDRAGGGQILASDVVRHLIGTRGDLAFNDVGFMELKGFRSPLPAAEILWREHVEAIPRPGMEAKSSRLVSRRRALSVGVGLFVAAIAAVSLLFRSTEDGGDGPRLAETIEAGSISLQWTREPSGPGFDGLGEQVMTGVASDVETMLAPGRDDRSGDVDATMWRQSANRGWVKVSMDGPGDRGGDQLPTDVMIRGPRALSVGIDGIADFGQWDAAVWTSGDGGATWTRVLDPDFIQPGEQVIHGVAGTRLRVVAVGYESLAPGEADGAIWVSETGTSWNRIQDQPGLFGGAGQQEIRDVVATDRGFVAVGRRDPRVEGDSSDAAVWISLTGNTWERLPSESLRVPGYQVMTTVIPGGPGYIAAGYDTVLGDPDAAVWTSRDGISWERVARSDRLFGGTGSQRIHALGRHEDLYIAAGVDGTDGNDDGGIWLSTDGSRWRRASGEIVFGGDSDQSIRGIAVVGDRVVAVGGDGETGDLDAAVWTAQVNRP